MSSYTDKSVFNAFTLAEVLITLGIIGVVAAMTIPTLKNLVDEMGYKESAKKAYSTASEAIAKMRNEEGGTFDTYRGHEYTFKPVFMTYFKVLKDCDWSDCVPTVGGFSSVFKTLDGQPASGWRTDEGQFITNDGMFWAIENENEVTQPRIMITVDVNGYQKNPNKYGADVFMFEILNNNLVPMGVPATYWDDQMFCNRTVSDTAGGFACMKYVMEGKSY